MGVEHSAPKELASNFTTGEIRRLAKRFQKLDVNNSGTLTKDEIMSLPGMEQNLLAHRIFDVFDTDDDGNVNFIEFMEGMTQFSTKGDKISKLRFAFRIYDLDKDGFISREDLFQVLRLMVDKELNDIQLHTIVNRTMQQADKDQDGKLSFEEFVSVVSDTDLRMNLKL